MKKALLIITLILSILLISSCSNKSELKIGKYIEVINEMAWVELMENNEYEFCRHIGTSFVPSGKYSIEDGELILITGENEDYRFKIDRDKLIYKSGPYTEGLVKIGTVFQYSEKDN